MNKKAFTLIELLAVIIILGLLMAIAIPSVTRYINNSRKKVYANTLDSYVDGLTKMFANGDIPGMYEEDTTYYVPFSCITTEKGEGSPNGDWEFAYVLVTNTSGVKNYSLYTKDVKSLGVLGVDADKLDASDVQTIKTGSNNMITVDGTNKILMVDETCGFANLISKEPGMQPEDSCFTLDAADRDAGFC